MIANTIKIIRSKMIEFRVRDDVRDYFLIFFPEILHYTSYWDLFITYILMTI